MGQSGRRRKEEQVKEEGERIGGREGWERGKGEEGGRGEGRWVSEAEREGRERRGRKRRKPEEKHNY